MRKKPSKPVATVLDRLKAKGKTPTPADDGWSACCPAHDDQNPSLSVSEADDGRALLHCHGGCEAKEVAKAHGLTMHDLFPQRGGRSSAKKPRSKKKTRATQRAESHRGLPPAWLKRRMQEAEDALTYRRRQQVAKEYLGNESRRWVLARYRVGWDLQQQQIVCPEFTPAGEPCGLFYRPLKRSASGSTRGLTLPRDLPSSTSRLFVTEGASDCWALAALLGETTDDIVVGRQAKSTGAAAVLELARRLHPASIVVVADDDDDGAEAFSRHLARGDWEVRWIRPPAKDLREWVRNGATRRLFAQLVEQAEPVQAGLVVTNMGDVQPVPIRWLWPQRIALGKVTMIAGDPDLGKSWLTHWMAACVSAGRSWPDGDGKRQPVGDTILLTAEDDPADTIQARLTAARAKLRRVNVVEAVRGPDDDHERMFSLARDLPHLEALLTRLPKTRLLIIDPISAYLDRTDSHNNAEVRGLLAPLASLAARHELAVVCVTHLTKNSDRSPIYRAMGSLAFVAAARAVWAVVRDKEMPRRRLFVPVKNNLGRDEGHGLAFTIDDSGLAWEPDPVDAETAAAAFAPESSKQARPKLEMAKDWLVRELHRAGRLAAATLIDRARDAGHSKITIERARSELATEGVLTKTKDKAAWHWELCNGEAAADASGTHDGDDGDDGVDAN